GVRTTSAPTLGCGLGLAVAVRVPVAPAIAWRESASSQVTWFEPAVELASPRSVIPAGGVIELPPPIEKNPMISPPATVLVTDGATIDVVSEFCASAPDTLTGAEVFTPW